MKMNSMFKKVIVSSLTLAIALGGSTAAFANGNDKGRDNNRQFGGKYEVKWDNKSNDRNVVRAKDDKGVDIEIRLSFDDVKSPEVAWALRYIASLASKKVFEGYEDGTFKPNSTIKRVEAIVAAVRNMGLEEEAKSKMDSPIYFKDADKIKKQYPWAAGYIAVAVEQDLFLDSDVNVDPEKPTDRLWATVLLVKSLDKKLTDVDLEKEAESKMNAKLEFKDAHKIPASLRGYVAVAVERGIIDGYEDKTFRPEAAVRRAEMAALLDRTGNQMEDKNMTTGKITAIANNVLSVESGGEVTQVVMDPNTFVFKDGQKKAITDLAVGDVVKVRAYNGIVLYVEVTTNASPTTPTQQTFSLIGWLKSFTVGSDSKLTTVTITKAVYGDNTDVTYNVSANANYTLGELSQNRLIELTGNVTDNVVTKIQAK